MTHKEVGRFWNASADAWTKLARAGYDVYRDYLNTPAFFDLLENYDGSPEYQARLDRFGINRKEPAFWPAYDWFQERVLADQPVHGGLYDLNRYYSEAREDAM